MAVKNARLGDKTGPEGGIALKNAGFGDREWTERRHGFEECMEDARP